MAKKSRVKAPAVPKANEGNPTDADGVAANTAITPPADQATNPATGEPVDQVTTEPDPGTPPVDPKVIPKQERPGRVPQGQRAIENMDIAEGIDVEGSDLTLGRQVNPEEAVAYAMTQEDPVRAIKRLNGARQLKDITSTFAKMEENGFKMS